MGEMTYTDFPYKLNPFKHQHDCFTLSRDREAYAFFMEMGTGKTKVAIDTAAYLFLIGKIMGLLIVAPKSAYMNWTENELPKHMPDAVPYRQGFWSAAKRKSDMESLDKLMESGSGFLRVMVVNIEAFNTEAAVDRMTEFMEKFPTLMVIDESTTIKNPNAKRTKVAINVGKFAKYRRICSGNPIPNGPMDLYSQSEFLKRNILGYSNFFAYRNRFGVIQQKHFGARSFKTIVGFRDLDVLKNTMSKFSFIIKKAECLTLPPKIYEVIDVEMGPKQKDYYNRMLNDAYIQLEAAKVVTATMVMVQLVKLHQIVCGFLAPDGMDPVPIGEPLERLETLLDLLDQAPGKVIIWANYRYNIKQLIASISEKFGPDSVAGFYGDTPVGDPSNLKPGTRIWVTKSFQDPSHPLKYIVANPESGRFSNTWTAGKTVIYYSNNYNAESREQSEDRAHRIGQDESVLYIDLRVRGTVDDRILKILKGKKKLTDEVVQSNWQWLLGEKVM